MSEMLPKRLESRMTETGKSARALSLAVYLTITSDSASENSRSARAI